MDSESDSNRKYNQYRPKPSTRSHLFKKNVIVKYHATLNDNTSSNFSNLPNVCLAKIFKYLSLKERLNASLSCKNWRLILFNTPCLWHDFNLSVLICKSYKLSLNFKMESNILNYSPNLTLKYDLVSFGFFLKNACNLFERLNSKHIRAITFIPCVYDKPQIDTTSLISYIDLSFNKRLLELLKRSILYSNCIEHFTLGDCFSKCVNENMNNEHKFKHEAKELILALKEKHSMTLKSLHLSTIDKGSYIFKKRNQSNRVTEIQEPVVVQTQLFLSNYLGNFTSLVCLSIDYEDLNDEFLNSAACLYTLERLNVNVKQIDLLNKSIKHIDDESWSNVKIKNKNIRVALNFLKAQIPSSGSSNLSNQCIFEILKPNIPLETFAMHFCKSLNSQLIDYIGNTFSHTLKQFIINDAITEPTLQYSDPLLYDIEPDSLVLLCWRCRHLENLTLIGYEIAEVNLVAIAKLRNNLKTFRVPLDCIIDLKYGNFFGGDNFVEDDDGEDIVIEYGFCRRKVIDKVSNLLKIQNWHPLKKKELPACLYNLEVSYENIYLDDLVKSQIYSTNFQ